MDECLDDAVVTLEELGLCKYRLCKVHFILLDAVTELVANEEAFLNAVRLFLVPQDSLQMAGVDAQKKFCQRLLDTLTVQKASAILTGDQELRFELVASVDDPESGVSIVVKQMT